LQESLEKALQARLDGRGSMIYKTAWKPHATPLGRQIFRLRASAHRTSGNAPSSALSGWPTPQAGTPAQNGNNPAGNSDYTRKCVDLVGWNTPRATDGSNGGPNQAGGALPADAALAGWPTPVAHEARLGYQNRRNGKKGSQKSLTTEAVDFLDPSRGDPGLTGWEETLTLDGPARITARGEMLTGCSAGMESGGQLCPRHSGWLMGYPETWFLAGMRAHATFLLRKIRKGA